LNARADWWNRAGQTDRIECAHRPVYSDTPGHSPPLDRNVLPEELGATGLFLASDGAAAITGQILYVDCGYQIMGM
jgi:enoyl-[acyl-carrier-protein] reductase (NADH)